MFVCLAVCFGSFFLSFLFGGFWNLEELLNSPWKLAFSLFWLIFLLHNLLRVHACQEKKFDIARSKIFFYSNLTPRLLHTWRTMYESHQVQNHISHQLNLLSSYESIDPTTEYHRQATAQLETEVTSWYSSFGRLVKSQGDYVRTLCRWAELTACLVDDHQNECSSIVCTLCKKWQHALDRLPDKVWFFSFFMLQSIGSQIMTWCSHIYTKEKNILTPWSLLSLSLPPWSGNESTDLKFYHCSKVAPLH